ncbi:unnamed protein product [Nippostrongylus brasiliensis]|uniref:DUF1767 domain-containing protein n=1 Tax=Nippostrongylus brasiliensis TaxID=27835 RepID=A0A0N4Y5U7_NIPBR|nr:unnamed protein product [Nippostrongylus brasiliensis]
MAHHDESYQERINAKVLMEWVRISGLPNQKKASFDQVLQDFAERILEYPKDLPRAFSWPSSAGLTNGGHAIRPMSPPTAVVRLSMDLKGWNGSPLSDMLSNREKNEIRAGRLKFGSLKLNGVDVNPDLVKEVNLESNKRVGGPELEDENNPQEATPADASTSQPDAGSVNV